MSKSISVILFVLIFILGLSPRLVGVNWDNQRSLHPDERFLAMVASSMAWPESFSHYLSSATSSLNPHNLGYDFYVYGTFPPIAVKFVAGLLGRDDYFGLIIVGRCLSALLDAATGILVYLIARKIHPHLGLLAMLAHSLSVLPIQLSHFFAVDPYATFFITLSFYFLIEFLHRPSRFLSLLLAASFALAVSAKISVIIFAPVLALGFLLGFIRSPHRIKFVSLLFLFAVTFLLVFRVSLPYLFLGWRLNPAVLANWHQLNSLNSPEANFPPGVQWIGIPKGVFPLINLLLWGLGLPLGLASLGGLVAVFMFRTHRSLSLLAVGWTLVLFVFQSLQYAQPMRYFCPLYPFLALTAAAGIYQLGRLFRHSLIYYFFVVILLLIWPLSFSRIYLTPHPRVAADRWISQNIPLGSVVSCEHWDDCLPFDSTPYRSVQLPLYDPDSSSKWSDLTSSLASLDYLIITSNRLYGSIMGVPDRYPVTSRFYSDLFSGQLGFKLVAQFTSRPGYSFPAPSLCLDPGQTYGAAARQVQVCAPGLSFVDDYADETFTVYDHPKVLIFQNEASLTPKK